MAELSSTGLDKVPLPCGRIIRVWRNTFGEYVTRVHPLHAVGAHVACA